MRRVDDALREVVEVIDDRQVAVRVELADVPGAKPSAAGHVFSDGATLAVREALGGGAVVVKVSRRDEAADLNLTGHVRPNWLAVGDDAQLLGG